MEVCERRARSRWEEHTPNMAACAELPCNQETTLAAASVCHSPLCYSTTFSGPKR